MARLIFRFTPLDTADFDVCAGPPRPRAPAPEPAEATAEILPPPAEKRPEPAEG